MRNKIVSKFIIGTFVTLYIMVSLISTVHVIEFFRLSNPEWLAISLAIAFEVGAAASLASLIILKKMNKGLIWTLFILLTLMQAMGNTYYSFMHLENFSGWIELFDLVDEELLYQKRVLSIISGAILPLIALGFIKSLVDYIKPEDVINKNLDIEKEITYVEEDELADEEIKEMEEYIEPDPEIEDLTNAEDPERVYLEVDGGNSATEDNTMVADSDIHITSEPEPDILNINTERIKKSSGSIKRYPENLE